MNCKVQKCSTQNIPGRVDAPTFLCLADGRSCMLLSLKAVFYIRDISTIVQFDTLMFSDKTLCIGLQYCITPLCFISCQVTRSTIAVYA